MDPVGPVSTILDVHLKVCFILIFSTLSLDLSGGIGHTPDIENIALIGRRGTTWKLCSWRVRTRSRQPLGPFTLCTLDFYHSSANNMTYIPSRGMEGHEESWGLKPSWKLPWKKTKRKFENPGNKQTRRVGLFVFSTYQVDKDERKDAEPWCWQGWEKTGSLLATVSVNQSTLWL